MRLPTHATSLLAFSLSLTALTGATTLDAQAVDFQQGRIYQGGQTIRSVPTGVTFTLPQGFAGQWDAEAAGLVVQSTGNLFGGVWAWSDGTPQDAAGLLEGTLAELGVQLAPRGEPTVSASEIRGSFRAMSMQGAGVLHAWIRKSPAGGLMGVVALTDATGDEAGEAFVSDVGNSASFATPEASGWRAQVEGAVLSWSSSGSDMSTGGGATATGASQSQAQLAFCAGGYRYSESSETYVGIEGVSASSSSADAHGGEWALVADLGGNVTLYLFATDGRSFEWSVEEATNGVLVDGYLYRPAGDC